MDRRSFLMGTSAITSQLLLGCSGNNKTKLTIELLKDSLPAQVVGEFRRTLKDNEEVNIALVEQLQDVFNKLEAWQKPQKKDNKNLFGWPWRLPFQSTEAQVSTDLLTLGDFWLREAIQKKLIQPIDVNKVSQWSAMPEQWRSLVTRNDKGFLDPQGKIWGAPYRWGNTVIVYRRDKFEDNKWAPPRDWADLWRKELSARISLLNHPREVVGLVLKKLKKSYNTENLASVPLLEEELKNLNQQVKFYDSTKYIEPLLLADTLVALGWSQDVLPIIARYPSLAAIVPQSGTAQSVDVWVRPARYKTQQELSTKWIDFLLQKNISSKIAVLTKTHSPIATNINASEILNKSEFLLPLAPEIERQYVDLFEKIKNS
jgi:putative spermidine/putrescine transport system substrate-binding protein